MTLIQNFPFFCIILSMFSAIASFALNGRLAKWLHVLMVTAVFLMSCAVLGFTLQSGESYTFMMGHYPAPWGNEIRIGILEALMAASFSLIMLLSVFGGMAHIDREVQNSKKNLFYILMDLLLSSLLALIYTNDLFTAYVFIEICTIAACGLIMIRKRGRTYVSALRYMIMSLVGSGLFLIGLTLLYCISGQLLMSPAKEALQLIPGDHAFRVPFAVIVALLTVGLGIKSGLYPFHTWIPDAYAYSTPAASAVLSSLVSKGYLFLMLKIFYRVLGTDTGVVQQMFHILFVFGLIGMIMGSVAAIREKGIMRMTAYSSVAQIGYIYMGIGFGTTAGMVAAAYHMISHGIMKSLLFISASKLIEASGGQGDFESLKGAGHRDKIAGLGFAVGSLSMIGMPLLTGFVSKYLFAAAATDFSMKMLPAWIVLGISTILNTVYFMHTVLNLYLPADGKTAPAVKPQPGQSVPSRIETAAIVGMVLLHIALGVASPFVIHAIEAGLSMFG